MVLRALPCRRAQRSIYGGWGSKLFWLDVVAIAVLAAIIVRFPAARTFAFAALGLLLLAGVAAFANWIAPPNDALDVWTLPTPMADWRTLRANWEWGHAARAANLSAATLAISFAMLCPTDRSRRSAVRPT